MMSHRNVLANFEQVTSDYFATAEKFPRQTPLLCRGCPSITTWFVSGSLRANSDGTSRCAHSPVAFLQRPARWMQLLASNSKAYSAAPNFAFEIAVKKTSDDDMAGLISRRPCRRHR